MNKTARVVLGQHGAIGKELAKSFSGESLFLLSRETYADWWDEKNIKHIQGFFEQMVEYQFIQIYVAVGILDQHSEQGLIERINCGLPINIVRAVQGLNCQVTTFGTVHELFPMNNPYLNSKRNLAESLKIHCDKEKYRHVRLHTLYDDFTPKEFMFLGQLFNCMRKGSELRMSSGLQIREFHYVKDIIKILQYQELSHLGGELEINHGESISLIDLTNLIASHFPDHGLINQGFYEDPISENYDQGFMISDTPRNFQFQSVTQKLTSIFQSINLV